MSAPSYPDTMTADTDTASRPSLRAKLTRRLTRAEYAVSVAVGLASWLLFRAAGYSGAAWLFPAAVIMGWLVWMLARPIPASVANAPLCRWCGLWPVAVLCGGRADGGPCEAEAAESVPAGR